MNLQIVYKPYTTVFNRSVSLSMRVENLLKQRKATILKRWFDLVAEAYPANTSQFLKKQKDPFMNPVGSVVLQNLEPLFDELLAEMDYETIKSLLDPIVRIRAVQNLSPSQAISFTLLLKKIIRENLSKELSKSQTVNELLLFESKIDEIALIAFDIYIKCREKIYEIKANEERNRTFSALKRAGLISEAPEVETGFKTV